MHVESFVTPRSAARLLEGLEELKRPSGAQGRRRLRALLGRLARARFQDAKSLVRVHEALLFMRAYPQGRQLLRQTEKLLRSFGRFVDGASEAGVDLGPLAAPEVSGLARTEFSVLLGYETVRWLARAHPSRAEINWDDYEETAHLFAVLPRLLPLFEEDSYVDTHTPFRAWLRAAKRRGETDLGWLVRNFERLPLDDRQRPALFDPLKIWVRWRLGDSASSRTRARLPARKVFFHDGPFLGRRDVSLARELESSPLPVEKLARREAEKVLAVARDVMAVRVRELYGFSHPDERTVVRADAGRGTEIYCWGVPPAWRFPLLAYLCGLVSKNGVPVAYAEALTFFERSEVGFNLFYTFREGESAWAYARVLRLFRQLHGVETFSVEAYQLGGSGNEEGVASGAFWFYRKLGFRTVEPEPTRLMLAEERRMASRPGYRTPPATLRRLASGNAVYETRHAGPRAWDRFRFRHVGLAVQRRLGREFDGDAARLRDASTDEVLRALRARTARWNDDERRALSGMSPALALIPDLARWTTAEKQSLLRIIRTKAAADETKYARLLHTHPRLRRAFIALGSASGD